jgi:4-amino-4-deoxy-L-arabinose transferase-like glycosyltransferase
MAAAALRVASTYTVFSETADEHHFVAGLEWWDRGMYTYTIYHPPLARIASALPLYLSGARSHGLDDIVAEKNAILYSGIGYARNLALARLGILPFLLLAALLVWLWSRRLYGEGAGLAAALLFSTLPPVLAHSGLTTTDAPLMATLTWALFAFCRWLETPTLVNGVLLGVSGGSAILSKFSAFPFFFWSAVAILLVRAAIGEAGPAERAGAASDRLRSLACAAAVAALLIWAAYRFSWGTLPATTGPTGRTVLVGAGASPATGIWIPAPEFWEGLRQIRESVYLRGGHPSYLLGRYSLKGWWYYFPIALAIKTPLAFLILTAGGVAAAVGRMKTRKDWRILAPIVASVAILASSLFSRTDIGVRHILPIYPLLAIAAGCGVVKFWNAARARRAARVFLVALMGWQVWVSIRAHPDYLAYFNELAGKHPDRILLDSNLDWGQDLYRLSDELRRRGVDSLALAYFGNADLTRHGLPPSRPLPPDHPTTGWIAISEMWLKDVAGGGKAYAWLRAREPVALVGKSIRLYYVPPAGD